MLYALGLLAALIAVASSKVIDTTVIPGEWEAQSRADGSTEIKLVIAVKQQNVEVLKSELMAVSEPKSDRYGQHLTSKQVSDLVKPSMESSLVVKAWLRRGLGGVPIENYSRNGDFLSVVTTIADAEELLGCEYYTFKHAETGETVIRVRDNYHVPQRVASHVDFVSPTKRFPPRSYSIRSAVSKVVGNLKAGETTPTTLKKLYNVGDTVGKSDNNTMAVASFIRQYYDKDDLETFWKNYDINNDISEVTDVPTTTPSGYGDEAELDTQYLSSVAENVPMQVWYTSGEVEPFLTWIEDVVNSDDPAWLYSMSYGQSEASAGLSYATRMNTELAKAGTMGISIFLASGDSGAGTDCIISGGAESPDYPASSPYVTAVGGLTSEDPEEPWRDGGGGFSNLFGQPSYQYDDVQSYLNTNNDLPPSSDFNSTGRGYPDIAAQATDFAIVVRGFTLAVDGTSCASPTAAAIFALLNDLRLQNGKSTLGFLNPFIYSQSGSGFNDVTSGNIKGCGGGFYAQSGWDAATGWGSPDYSELADAVLSL